MSMLYCIDTSAWIEFADVYLMGDPRTVGMWDWLESAVERRLMFSPTEVFEELKSDEEIGEWIRERRGILEIPPDNALVAEFARLNQAYPELTTKGRPKAKNVADAWVVACATLGRPSVTVVSKEALLTNPNKITRCIPGVCQKEAVPHIAFLDFVKLGI